MKETIKVFERILLSCMLIVLAIISGTETSLAYDTRTSQAVNHFLVGNTEIEVLEAFDGTTKSDVKIINRGNIPVYVRAVITVYWKDAEGNVLLETPGETDYQLIRASETSEWAHSAEDGFFYYQNALKPGETTTPLIEECRDLKRYNDGRILVVDIAAQSIQEIPSKENNEVSE